MHWNPVEVNSWTEDIDESRGRREKIWVLEPETSIRWLRKTPVARAPCECAIEHTVLELARACRLVAATSRPAFWTGARNGIVVRSFLNAGDSLDSGANVIRGYAPDVVLDDSPAGHAAHSPALALAALRHRSPALVEPLLCMFLFDAWVGNGDRHSENWSIVSRGGSGVLLAPMYDVSSCFGSGLQDGYELLSAPTDALLVKFVLGCPSGFGDGTGIISMAEVVAQFQMEPEWARVRDLLLPRFVNVNTSSELTGYFNSIGDEWLSSPRKRLVRMLLTRRLAWLEKCT